MGKLYLILIILFSSFYYTVANNNKTSSDTTKNKVNYDPIVSTIDSFMMIKISETNIFDAGVEKISKFNFAIDSVPAYNDLIYEYRMAQINSRSPIQFDYNSSVKNYIDMYTVRRREQVSRMLGLAQLYFPLFEETLDKYNLPLELKYLAIVESALNPNAKSKSGAMGLWQFMYNSASMFDLKIDSYVDERCDPIKSTDAAARYLEYLHRIFNDWQLALAAYNGGPGIVRNAIARSGGKTTFWEIRPYLPKETQGYVPAFIAATYVMSYTAEHNIYPIPPKINFNQTDTIKINKELYFNQISAALGIPEDLIKFLNPMYKQNFIPYYGETMSLILPTDKIAEFISKENEIYNSFVAKDDFNSLVAKSGSTDDRVKIIHTVKRGEYFHKIAIKYRCTIDNIIAWNNLQTYSLNEGQKLTLWLDPSLEIQLEANDVKPQNYFYYTIQFGDSFESIADKFKLNSSEILIKENNISKDFSLEPGLKIKIPN